MAFTDLVLRTLDDQPGVFEVVNDTIYTWTDDPSLIEKWYKVPAGSTTDLASIPWCLRWLFSRTGKSRKPAVFHDHMYGKKWRTRKECDLMLKQMLRERGMSWFAAQHYYLGVRAGGWTRGNW